MTWFQSQRILRQTLPRVITCWTTISSIAQWSRARTAGHQLFHLPIMKSHRKCWVARTHYSHPTLTHPHTRLRKQSRTINRQHLLLYWMAISLVMINQVSNLPIEAPYSWIVLNVGYFFENIFIFVFKMIFLI